MVAGLEAVSAGEIHLAAARIDALPPGERGVAMVFQHYALYPHMTVRQNMAFGLRNIGTPAAEIARQGRRGGARCWKSSSCSTASQASLRGGQRQRVAIGRAIVKQPKAFLFDEPLSNLDAALRSRTRIELARLHQRMRTTMVFVTHDQVEAMTHGHAHRGDEPAAGSSRSARRWRSTGGRGTRFVAGFIGTPAMNFLPVDARRGARAAAPSPCSADGTEVVTAGARRPPAVRRRS